jgi:hypothetical protein
VKVIKLSRWLFLSTAFLCAGGLSQTAQEPIPLEVRDLRTVPAIRPIEVNQGGAMEYTLRHRQMGFGGVGSWGVQAGQNPNQSYRQAYTFPELHLEVSRRIHPLSGKEALRGLSALKAVQRIWTWPPPDNDYRYVPPVQIRSLWRWEVPSELREHYRSFGRTDGHDRYEVLGLYQASIKRQQENPHLFYFDTLTGLRWHLQTDIYTAYCRYKQIDMPQSLVIGVKEFLVGVSRAGDRVFAMASLYGPRNETFVLLSIYDMNGSLLKTILFPNTNVGPAAPQVTGLPGSGMGRTASGRHFIVSFGSLRGETETYREPGYYLIDIQGSVIGYFVNDLNQPISLSSVSRVQVPDESIGYALAHRFEDGQSRTLLYRLSSVTR